MNKEQFINELKKININLTDQMLKQLDKYYQLLVRENDKYNLTSITEENQVYLKHFYDSLTISKIINFDSQSLIDIGSGAGFPGLVLKIVFPNLSITLLDSTKKKCDFLELVIKELSLEKITVINARCEDYAKINREKYDLATSRAVAPLKHLLEFSAPLLKVNGSFIALKSNLTEEIVNIEKYYQKLNLSFSKEIQFKLPCENSLRTLYKVDKIAPTNNIYPRPYSQMKKKEL